MLLVKLMRPDRPASLGRDNMRRTPKTKTAADGVMGSGLYRTPSDVFPRRIDICYTCRSVLISSHLSRNMCETSTWEQLTSRLGPRLLEHRLDSHAMHEQMKPS